MAVQSSSVIAPRSRITERWAEKRAALAFRLHRLDSRAPGEAMEAPFPAAVQRRYAFGTDIDGRDEHDRSQCDEPPSPPARRPAQDRVFRRQFSSSHGPKPGDERQEKSTAAYSQSHLEPRGSLGHKTQS